MASTLAAALDFVEEAAQALLRRAPGSLVGAVVDPVDLGAPAAGGGDGHSHGGGSPSASGTFLAGVAALRWKARAFPASPEALKRSVSRMPVPERPDDLTLGWMRAALVRAGLLAAPEDLAAMEVAPVGAPGLLSEVMRVTLTLAAGASERATGDGRPCPPSVIVKMPTVVAENRELAEDSNCYELVSDETRAGAGRRLTGGLDPLLARSTAARSSPSASTLRAAAPARPRPAAGRSALQCGRSRLRKKRRPRPTSRSRAP